MATQPALITGRAHRVLDVDEPERLAVYRAAKPLGGLVVRPFVVGTALILAGRLTLAQAPIDSALAKYINGIRAIDDHAHPMRPVLAGAPADTDFDALPLDRIPAFDLPNRVKADDPIWRLAENALYR